MPERRRISAVVFDLDGTLVDTVPIVVKTYVETIKTLGGPNVGDDELHASLYLGSTAVLLESFVGRPISDDDLACFFSTYERAFAEAGPFPGIVDMLDQLTAQEYPLGVYTGAPRRSTQFVLDKLGLASRLACVVCGDEVAHPKPAADGLEDAAKSLGIGVSELAFVGDTPFDLDCAHAAGALAVHAMWSSEATYEGDHLIARVPADVAALVADYR